jgi:dihydroorotase-like cyclic amidohydrolase
VDLFATDHCAFTRADKDRCRGHIPDVPNGIAGIGALPHLVYALFAQQRHEPVTELARCLAANPARLLGAYPRKGVLARGSDADFSICRAVTDGRPVRSSLADVYETYPGETSRLWFERVFVRGWEVVRDNTLLHPGERRGKSVWPI